MTMDKKNLYISFFVSILGAFLVFYIVPVAVVSPGNIKIPVMDPAFWPSTISWVILLIGVSMFLTYLVAREGESSSVDEFSLKKEWGSLLIVFIFVGYYLLLPDLGMVWASSLAYLFLSLVVFKTKHRVSAVIVGLVLPVALYVFFYHVAGVNIPQSEVMRLP